MELLVDQDSGIIFPQGEVGIGLVELGLGNQPGNTSRRTERGEER